MAAQCPYTMVTVAFLLDGIRNQGRNPSGASSGGPEKDDSIIPETEQVLSRVNTFMMLAKRMGPTSSGAHCK